MPKHLVLVGGGHAHMVTMTRISEIVERGHRVTLVSPSEHHYYSGMGPGMLSRLYRPQEARFNVRKLVEGRGGAFVEDSVERVDADARVLHRASGESLSYDVVSFNTGSSVNVGSLDWAENDRVYTVKPVARLLDAQRALLKRLQRGAAHVLLVGGGAAGVELAGNAWRLARDEDARAEITLVGGQSILSGFPPKVRRLAFRSLARRGVNVVENALVERMTGFEAVLADGRRLPFDLAFLGTGVTPSQIFRASDLPVGGDGGLLVNDDLQSTAHPEIFGGGDCITMEGRSLARVGVYAVRQNPILFHNLLAALEGRPLEQFRPQSAFLMILNMGDGTGIMHKRGVVCHGRWVFGLKDHIDRRFMRKFQLSGELDAPG